MKKDLSFATAAFGLLLLVTSVFAADEVANTPPKPGYMIVIGEGVDPTKMSAYAGIAVPLLLKAGGELIFVTDEGQTEVIEGAEFAGSIRVLRFPSLQAARDFYYSDEYQAAIPLRAGNGELQVMLAEGWVPDPKWFNQEP